LFLFRHSLCKIKNTNSKLIIKIVSILILQQLCHTEGAFVLENIIIWLFPCGFIWWYDRNFFCRRHKIQKNDLEIIKKIHMATTLITYYDISVPLMWLVCLRMKIKRISNYNNIICVFFILQRLFPNLTYFTQLISTINP